MGPQLYNRMKQPIEPNIKGGTSPPMYPGQILTLKEKQLSKTYLFLLL